MSAQQVVPLDPKSPEGIAACDALCDAIARIETAVAGRRKTAMTAAMDAPVGTATTGRKRRAA